MDAKSKLILQTFTAPENNLPLLTAACKTLGAVSLSIFLLVGTVVLGDPSRIPLVAPVKIYTASPAINPPNPWHGYPLLKRIASCESAGDPAKEPRQFLQDGSVLHGFPNADDIGLAQINQAAWGRNAKRLGFDIYTYEGNLNMAKWLFNRYGSSPWHFSKGCWGHDATSRSS